MTVESQVRYASERSVKNISIRQLRPAFQRQASSFSAAWSGVAGGIAPPGWWAPDLLIPGAALELFSIEDAYYVPSSGAVLTAGGQLFASTAQQAMYIDPKLEKLANIWSTRFTAPRIDEGVVTMPFGALHNYGHFVLDAMTSVAAIVEEGDFRQVPFVTAPLKGWHRQYFELLNVQPLELSEPIYSFGRITFSSGMNNSLHKPNCHFHTLRDAVFERVPATTSAGAGLIYISRKGHHRPLINEAELEVALKAIGFSIIQPETLPIAEQINIFRSAKIVVAPTGAAMANLLFSRKETAIEILPRDMTLSDTGHKWVAFLTAMGEGDWRPYFCEDVSGVEQPEINGVKRAGLKPFTLSVADLISFIENVLDERTHSPVL
ncbi:hypothetical protein CCR94_08725 [Rhodoblastus sphagnicola]|uniref:Glycosyltransferase 61 catalytic domain-containing protein n=1 Tax=Rhodoblastus sphagnicola TaxID=333368 RepID=A0A2S6N9U5_9HYPH|nr:glycosyltransferase 61 family protein [Rhodoblastus sphagnicola]MBB4198745.1 capsular polysaccharide biosynthesis protein [Rhodoblastus sphagnicola]PPQ31385.1 hypothetical protein CCR94_08725 [Rhodoblastus sphagnicola]